MKPSIGRIVLYQTKKYISKETFELITLPAIILALKESYAYNGENAEPTPMDCANVDLMVFGSYDVVSDRRDPCIKDVPFCPKLKADHWTWPQKV